MKRYTRAEMEKLLGMARDFGMAPVHVVTLKQEAQLMRMLGFTPVCQYGAYMIPLRTEVGYALGISDTTVAAHLGRALTALGVQSRSEWIRISAEVAAAAHDGAKLAADRGQREAS